MPHVAVEVDLAGFERRQPIGLQVRGREPQGMIEKPIHRAIERPHRHFGGLRRAQLGQRSHGFQPNLRMLVFDERRQVRPAFGTRGMPGTEHARGGGAHVMIGRMPAAAASNSGSTTSSD